MGDGNVGAANTFRELGARDSRGAGGLQCGAALLGGLHPFPQDEASS